MVRRYLIENPLSHILKNYFLAFHIHYFTIHDNILSKLFEDFF